MAKGGKLQSLVGHLKKQNLEARCPDNNDVHGSGSRTNYSSLDGGLLVRSTSFPSVNGADQSMSLSTNNLDRGGSRTSLAGSRRGDYASTESLHMTPAPAVNTLPPTDENTENAEVFAHFL